MAAALIGKRFSRTTTATHNLSVHSGHPSYLQDARPFPKTIGDKEDEFFCQK